MMTTTGISSVTPMWAVGWTIVFNANGQYNQPNTPGFKIREPLL